MKAARFLLAASFLFTPDPPSAQVAADAKLVYVNVVVTNSSGRFITGLTREHFKLFEESMQQSITSFAHGDIPISVGIVLDGSTGWRNEVKATALPTLAKGRTRDDETFLADSPDLTTNEAVYQATNRVLQMARNTRRAVVLFTDRRDPGAYAYSKFKDTLRDNDIAFFVVAPASSTNADSVRVLTALAEDSGGRAFLPAAVAVRDLEGVSQKILQELRHGYRIGYRPTNTVEDGKWRKVKVTVEYVDIKKNKVMKLNVRAKDGYYAPISAAAAVHGKK